MLKPNPVTALTSAAEALVSKYPDRQTAIARIYRWIRAHRDNDDVQQHVAWLAATQLASSLRHESTRHGRRGLETLAASRSRAGSSVDATAHTTALMDSVLVANKLLRDCTRSDLLDAAAAERQSARGSLAKALWLEGIAAKLRKDDETVETRWDAITLGTLYAEACSTAAQTL